jgi:hypothetical protein
MDSNKKSALDFFMGLHVLYELQIPFYFQDYISIIMSITTAIFYSFLMKASFCI